MADDHDAQQRDSFHWPPTSEELDSIQVIEVHEDAAAPVAPPRKRWHRLIDGPIVAQAGLAFASLASIGIAITSLLAPAQPARTSKRDTIPVPAPIIASATVPVPTASAPAPGSAESSNAESTTFQHRVTFDPPPPSIAELRAQRAAENEANAAGRNARAGSSGSESSASTAEARAARGRDGRAGTSAADLSASASSAQAMRQTSQIQKPRAGARATRTTLVARNARAQATQSRREAGTDPVSRLAVHTGRSVWKAMRAVGRSFKHEPYSDEGWAARPATRAAGARRTAAAVNLAADDAPSAR